MFTSPRALKSGKFASFFPRPRSHHVVGVTAAFFFPPLSHARVHFARLYACRNCLFCFECARSDLRACESRGSNFSQAAARILGGCDPPGAAVRPAGGGERGTRPAHQHHRHHRHHYYHRHRHHFRGKLIAFVRVRKSARALLMSSSRGCAAK